MNDDEPIHIHNTSQSHSRDRKRKLSSQLSGNNYDKLLPKSKRKRGGTSSVNGGVSAHSHPYGVKPLGNLYFSDVPECRTWGLGYFSFLEDDTIMAILSELSPKELCRLSYTSKSFFVFAETDLLWKEICLEEYLGNFRFQGSWKKTFAFEKYKYKVNHVPVQANGLFSDILYNISYCSSINPVKWSTTEHIDRRSNLSPEEFFEKYASKNIPVVITDVVTKWPAYEKWTKDYLHQKFGKIIFKTDKQIEMTLDNYLQYCESVVEERPIYLFDNSFGERAPDMLTDFSPPKNYFPRDYFSVMDKTRDKDRPSFRWLLVGPPRAGATFHKDPNLTSAWHGLIHGKKKWILYPPDVTPLGIMPSADGLEVTGPSTMVQWFEDFYDMELPVKPYETVLNAGELMFIPSGWWHTVINLTETWAITQNFVDDNNLDNVCKFLLSKKSKKLWNCFSEDLKREYPMEFQKMAERLKQQGQSVEQQEGQNNNNNDNDEDDCESDMMMGGGGMTGGGGRTTAITEGRTERAEGRADGRILWSEFVGAEEEDSNWQLF